MIPRDPVHHGIENTPIPAGGIGTGPWLVCLGTIMEDCFVDTSVDADADADGVNVAIEINVFLPSINANVNADARCE